MAWSWYSLYRSRFPHSRYTCRFSQTGAQSHLQSQDETRLQGSSQCRIFFLHLYQCNIFNSLASRQYNYLYCQEMYVFVSVGRSVCVILVQLCKTLGMISTGSLMIVIMCVNGRVNKVVCTKTHVGEINCLGRILLCFFTKHSPYNCLLHFITPQASLPNVIYTSCFLQSSGNFFSEITCLIWNANRAG